MEDSIKKDLEIVKQYQKEVVLLEKVIALLNWDEETHMPRKGIDTRAEKTALLARMMHEKLTSEEFFEAAKRAEGKLNGDDEIMIERLLYSLKKARKIPKEHVEEFSRITTHATHAWKEAREKKDFSVFAPHLEKIVEFKRREAEMIGMQGHLYNTFLDDYERGMTTSKVEKEFEKLKKGLIELIAKIKESKFYKNQKLILMKKEFPKELQMDLARDVVARIGLDKEFSRMDFAEHPFMTTIGMGDVRITTNIREDPLFSFGSSIHEAGHALYELGKPEEHFYNALGGEPSTGIHESQSRFWENMIGLSKEFWNFYFPIFNRKFNLAGDIDQWYDEVNMVQPTLIRIESDEVHYCLHIILRFEIEKGLIEGSIKVKDLPDVWNGKMKEYIGVMPMNDKEGVLQDVHWSNGYFGYFPTYAIGTIYAAQIHAQMVKEIPDYKKMIEKGEFLEIAQWLKKKVHVHGKKYLAEELIEQICGSGLDVKVYLDYLNKKYSQLYVF